MEKLLDRFCGSCEGVKTIKMKEVSQMSIETIMMLLLVGDGDRKRIARRKMLSPISKVVGCVVGLDMIVLNVGEMGRDKTAAV